MTFTARLGERLRRTREERRLLQDELAAKAGITQAALSNLEAGKRRPSMAMLDKLAEVLGVSVAYLLAEDDEPLADPEIHVMVRDLLELPPELRGVVKDTIRRLKSYHSRLGVAADDAPSSRYGKRRHRRPR